MRDLLRPRARPTGDGRGPLGGGVTGVVPAERLLWTLVVVALVLDVALTYWGLQLGLVEWNPVMRWAIAALGFPSLALSKVAVVGMGGVIRSAEVVWAPAIPLGIGLPWTAAVVLNLVILV